MWHVEGTTQYIIYWVIRSTTNRIEWRRLIPVPYRSVVQMPWRRDEAAPPEREIISSLNIIHPIHRFVKHMSNASERVLILFPIHPFPFTHSNFRSSRGTISIEGTGDARDHATHCRTHGRQLLIRELSLHCLLISSYLIESCPVLSVCSISDEIRRDKGREGRSERTRRVTIRKGWIDVGPEARCVTDEF